MICEGEAGWMPDKTATVRQADKKMAKRKRYLLVAGLKPAVTSLGRRAEDRTRLLLLGRRTRRQQRENVLTGVAGEKPAMLLFRGGELEDERDLLLLGRRTRRRQRQKSTYWCGGQEAGDDVGSRWVGSRRWSQL